jgi:penicillin-binding protein 1B
VLLDSGEHCRGALFERRLTFGGGHSRGFGLGGSGRRGRWRGSRRTAEALRAQECEKGDRSHASDGFRDSWFAGFSNDHLIVTWVGNDDNLATGLTGATGAARVWSGIMAELETHSYAAPLPTDLEPTWIDYVTGLATDASCPDAVALSLLSADIPPKASSCGSDRVRIGSRFRRFLRNALD